MLAHRARSRHALTLSLLGLATCLGLMSLVGGVLVPSVMLLCLAEVFIGMATPYLQYLRNILVPSEVRATALSIVNTVAALISAIAGAALGRLADVVGVGTVYLALSLILTVSVLASVILTAQTLHTCTPRRD